MVYNLKVKMLVWCQIYSTLKSGLENGKIIIKLTELPDQQSVDITFISSYGKELLSGHNIELITYSPFDVCIFN
jgi:hypothetical protein